MTDTFEIMKMFHLTEQPYILLGNVWCRNGNAISFIEDGVAYQEIQGDVIGDDEGILCINIDIQQFLGMQPAIFSSTLEISPELFEENYKELL